MGPPGHLGRHSTPVPQVAQLAEVEAVEVVVLAAAAGAQCILQVVVQGRGADGALVRHGPPGVVPALVLGETVPGSSHKHTSTAGGGGGEEED